MSARRRRTDPKPRKESKLQIPSKRDRARLRKRYNDYFADHETIPFASNLSEYTTDSL